MPEVGVGLCAGWRGREGDSKREEDVETAGENPD